MHDHLRRVDDDEDVDHENKLIALRLVYEMHLVILFQDHYKLVLFLIFKTIS